MSLLGLLIGLVLNDSLMVSTHDNDLYLCQAKRWGHAEPFDQAPRKMRLIGKPTGGGGGSKAMRLVETLNSALDLEPLQELGCWHSKIADCNFPKPCSGHADSFRQSGRGSAGFDASERGLETMVDPACLLELQKIFHPLSGITA